jgi:hypothetical protein
LATSHPWAFRARFKRGGFGWSGTKKAMERMSEALSEIEGIARFDTALAGEGAVILLEKLSPALSDIDSSSGSLGNAAAGLVETLVPLIAAAPVPLATREKWLERLFEAFQEDDPPYIESLGEHWGALCADPALASKWANQLLPLVHHVMADRRRGTYAYTKGDTPCFSALFSADRLDELLAVLALDPKPHWQTQQWAAKAMAVRGDVDGAIACIEGLRGPYASNTALSALAERFLLDAGRIEEAYAQYGIQATDANTHIARYRSLVKRYPGIPPSRILGDLIASAPGEEGKWFATAKTLKQFDLAIALAGRSPVDPKTLVRAARDHIKSQPAFALESALLALHWMASGAGYDLTSADVWAARDHALAAAHAMESTTDVAKLIAEAVTGQGAPAIWVRQSLGLS